MIAGAAWSGIPAWTLEATAEWAALASTNPAFNSQFPNADSRWINVYLNSPQTALFTRTYDAVVFWGHVQDIYGDLWTRVKTVLTSGSNSNTLFNAAGGNGDRFLSTWASSLADGAGGGPAWHLTSPIAVPAGNGVKQTDIKFSAASPVTAVTAAALTTSHFVIQANPAAPLVHIKINGHARFSSKHDYVSELKDSWFCIAGSAASCQCPSGEHGTVPAGYPVDGAAELQLTGDRTTGTAGTVEYSELGKFCSSTYKIPHPAVDRASRPPKSNYRA
jgi:hypothetical protein